MPYELVSEEESSLEGEFAVAKVEEIFEGRTEQIENHCVVIAFDSEPSHERDSDSSRERLVHFRFVLELRMLRLDRFEFDRDFFSRDDVDSEVDIT